MPRHPAEQAPQRVGETQAWQPTFGPLAAVVAFAAAAIGCFFMWPEQPVAATPDIVLTVGTPQTQWNNSQPEAQAQPAAAQAVALNLAKATPMSEVQPDGEDPTPDLSSYVNRGETPSMQEVITRLQLNNIQGGLAAFSPPGTRPAKIGLAVPEDMQLPPGYVRHHQATDDGQRIEAILMFSPDHQITDANFQAIEIPQDRVVPPHLAPPGFPTRYISLPAPRIQQP